MDLSREQKFALRDMAIRAALSAGEVVKSFVGKNVSNKNKAEELGVDKVGESYASQVVTEVDLLSQEKIVESIFPSLNEYNLGLLAEEKENDDSRFQKDYFWAIDPLDGTLPFIEGLEGYSISIALVSQKGIPEIGVIFDPVNDNLYYAIRGEGAFKNHHKWELPAISKDCFHFIMDRSLPKNEHYNAILSFVKGMADEKGITSFETIKHGGGAMNAIWVLENQPACYIKPPKSNVGGGSIWDFAASACIVNEQNAHVSSCFGLSLDLNRADSTFMNHYGAVYASSKYLGNRIVSELSQLILYKFKSGESK